MGKKKNSEVSEEITDVIDLDALEMELKDEAETSVDLESDALDEKTTELDLSEEPKTKKSRSKTKKAKKEKKADKEEDDSSEEITEVLEPVFLDGESEKGEKKETKKRSRKKPEAKEKDEASLPEAFEGSLKSMATHWKAVKENSDAFTQNIERVTNMLNELPANYDKMLDEMAQRYTPKTSRSMRIALSISVVAFVLSGISLIFSQSVRLTVLDQPGSTAAIESPRDASAVATRQSSDLSQFSKVLAPSPQKQNLNKIRKTRRRQ